MKTTINFFILAAVALLLNVSSAFAQVTPTTPNVDLFCDGADLVLPTPAAGTQYVMRYSATSTTTPSTTLTLADGVTIPAAELETGYYYLSIEGDADNPELCESDMQELPVYKFAPLTVAFTAADYCIEDATTQTFTGEATTTDATTLAYQWYTVVEGVETAITGATEATYSPSEDIAPGTTTTYRLKTGYVVDGLRYCTAVSVDVDVTVTAKPGMPTIEVEGSTGETW
ncbi:hypothetical protein [Parapedobacter sp. DT-150]|uniref:hypothetical protein n=1 Tax=Parapedobacter sp. DT-150 TaxID=3396162 RepID=UPI003F1CF349